MPVSFTLLTLSFALIHHNVCSWSVSEPLSQTLNDDGSISVTCAFKGKEKFEMEGKLIMNDKCICELYREKQQNDKCTWQHSGNTFTFTFMNPGDIHKNTFSCEIWKVKPFPIIKKQGPQTKLFQGCNSPLAPPISNCLCTNQTCTKDDTRVERTSPEDTHTLLICGLIIVLVLLFIYSTILTAMYIRLRVVKVESSDTLTYVPMQRNVKRRDLDNTEYVDMREVQKRGGSHRDMNHNSHVIPPVRAHF